ncbi:MAG: hypothetical protein DGJ47_000410 [Rickettsiaceae bacterium]
MSLKPLHNNVVLEPIAAEEKTAGGILLPDTAKEKPIQAKVIATGEGVRDNQGSIVRSSLKAGDIVIYAKWGGTEINVNGKDLVVMKETDIIGILEN